MSSVNSAVSQINTNLTPAATAGHPADRPRRIDIQSMMQRLQGVLSRSSRSRAGSSTSSRNRSNDGGEPMRTPFAYHCLVASLAAGGCVSILPTPIIPSALIARAPPESAVAPSDPLQADVAVFIPEILARLRRRRHRRPQRSGTDLPVGRALADSAPALLQGAVVNSLSKAGGPGRAAPRPARRQDRLRCALAHHRPLDGQAHLACPRRSAGQPDG